MLGMVNHALQEMVTERHGATGKLDATPDVARAGARKAAARAAYTGFCAYSPNGYARSCSIHSRRTSKAD
jgi:hypothetical protein